MDLLRGISEFQVDFDKLSAYFQRARNAVTEDAGKSKKKEPITEECEGTCVCLNRQSYFSHELSITYKRLLSTISASVGSGNPEEFPEFTKFQSIHRQLKKAQQKAAEDLQICAPCGHLVLPIDLEEAFNRHVHQEQLSRSPSGMYKLVGSTVYTVGRGLTAKLVHMRSFGSDSTLGKFTPNPMFLLDTMKMSLLEKAKPIEKKCAAISPEANVIVSTDVLIRVLRYLNSTTRCFFPIEIIVSPYDSTKRVALLDKPFLAEPLKNNRLRAQECFTELCKQSFVDPPQFRQVLNTPPEENCSNSNAEIEGALTIDSGTFQSIEDYSPNSKPSMKELREVVDHCHVVEAVADSTEMEILQEPASPELPLSPSHSPLLLCSPSSPISLPPSPIIVTTQATPTDNGFWNLFRLGPLNILVSSCGLQLSPQSCPSTTGCLFWPKCSELWSNTSDLNTKTVHVEIRPEYLQPWGCEELTEDELFSSCLGAQLSSPTCPTILRLRIGASTGKVILAEVQTVEQLLQLNPNFQFETHLVSLMNILSPLTRLPIGKYLLAAHTNFKNRKYQLYECVSDHVISDASGSSLLNFHRCVTENFYNAALALTSTSDFDSDRGATWRCVKRLRLDLSIPSGVDGDSLLIPAIDTGFFGVDHSHTLPTVSNTFITTKSPANGLPQSAAVDSPLKSMNLASQGNEIGDTPPKKRRSTRVKR